jgi:drug/metabolite transporter (DMT)-like permease
MIPSLRIEAGDFSFRIISFAYLLVGLFFYGLGAVYMKLFMTKGEVSLICGFSLLGATAYGLVAGMGSRMCRDVAALSAAMLFKVFAFSVVFSVLPSFLFLFVVRELGPVRANLIHFGQVAVGVLCASNPNHYSHPISARHRRGSRMRESQCSRIKRYC